MDPNDLRKLADDIVEARIGLYGTVTQAPRRLHQAADEIDLLTKKGHSLCIQIHDVRRERDEAKAEIERLRAALERAYDEGVHTTRCNIRIGDCTCWVAQADAALTKEEE
jgi:hypothetical protein